MGSGGEKGGGMGGWMSRKGKNEKKKDDTREVFSKKEMVIGKGNII